MIVTGPNVTEWVANRIAEFSGFSISQSIGWQRNGRILAGVVYENWNGPNVVCHIAAEGKNWLTRQYLWTIFDYPFNQLRAKRITAPVGEGNAVSRRFVEGLGFELEARLYGAHPSGDLLMYMLRKPQCRWLGIRRTEHEKLAA